MRWGRKVWALSVQKMRSSPDSGTLFQVSNVLFHIPRHSLLTSINQTVSIFRRFCRSHRFCCWPLSGQVTAGDQIRNLNFWIPNTSRWFFWQIPFAHGPKQSPGRLIATYLDWAQLPVSAPGGLECVVQSSPGAPGNSRSNQPWQCILDTPSLAREVPTQYNPMKDSQIHEFENSACQDMFENLIVSLACFAALDSCQIVSA